MYEKLTGPEKMDQPKYHEKVLFYVMPIKFMLCQ